MGPRLVFSDQVKSEEAGEEEMPVLPGKPPWPLTECAGTRLRRPPVATENFPPLQSCTTPVPYATPWPEPAAAWSSAGSSPDTPSPQPGLSQRADPARRVESRCRQLGVRN